LEYNHGIVHIITGIQIEFVRSFLSVILIIDFVILFLGYWPAGMAGGSGHYIALVIACFLTTINAALSYYTVVKSISSKSGAMLGAIFGGMGIRLIMLLGAFVAVVVLTDLPQFSFIIGLFICYLSKSVAEIIFINRIRNKSLSSN
jgi:hypothetical protein